MKGCLTVIGLIFCLSVLAAGIRQMWGGGNQPTSTPPAATAGAKVVLDAGTAPVLIAASERDLRQIDRYTQRQDRAGTEKMAQEGKVFLTDKGTTAEVIRTGRDFTELRLTSGPFAGRTGVTPNGFVKRLP